MAEDEKKNVNVNSEEIKEETKNTVNDVKETIKNVNIKDDAKKTTNFVTSMFSKPLETLKAVANDGKNKNLKHALILAIIWLVAILLKSLFGYHWAWRFFGIGLRSTIQSLLAPAIGIISMCLVIYFMQKGEKKTLTTIFTTVTIAATPHILVTVLSLLSLFSKNFYTVLSPLSSFATAITIVYMYFAMKLLIGNEENSKFIKKYTIIQSIYFIIYFALTFMEIYIPML